MRMFRAKTRTVHAKDRTTALPALAERLEDRRLMSAVIGTGNGLQGEYYDSANLTNLAVTRVDPTVNFNWSRVSPDPSVQKNPFSVRWLGEVQAEYSQTYIFQTTSNDGVRLWVNGQLLIDNWTNHPARLNRGTITLVAGQEYSIEMDYDRAAPNSVAKLRWSSHRHRMQIIPSSQLYPPTVTSSAGSTTGAAPPAPVNTGTSGAGTTGTGTTGTGTAGTGTSGTGSSGTSSSTDVPPIAGNWTSIFDDEFKGNTLSPSWSNSMWNETWNGTAAVSNGTLQLTAPNANTPMLINTETSAQPFSFTYGYAQVTMQVPKGQGVWPAFWMMPLQSVSHDQTAGEIDIFEGQGNVPNISYATYLWGKLPQSRIQTAFDSGLDLSQGYHTFGVDWEKDHITWYLDGKPIQTITSAGGNRPRSDVSDPRRVVRRVERINRFDHASPGNDERQIRAGLAEQCGDGHDLRFRRRSHRVSVTLAIPD